MKASRFYLLNIVLLVVVLVFSMQAQAELTLLGQGTSANGTYNLIYDTDLDVTWYDYTRDYDLWQNQMDWADQLSVTFGSNTYTDWRLPTTVDGTYEFGCDGTTTGGYNITSSDMGHLFYTALGNVGWYDTSCSGPQSGWGLTKTGDFQNLQPDEYWSGTEYSANSVNAWYFSTNHGNQFYHLKTSNNYAIAVMDGLAIVPEPVSFTLFLIGGATLGLRRFWKKRRNT